MAWVSGKKTYLVAGLMVVYAVSGWLLGKSPDVDWSMILEGLGLAALRAGVAKR